MAKTIRIKQLSPIYKSVVLDEDAPEWIVKRQPMHSSSDIYELFKGLVDEPREKFIALHLDNKHRLLCYDVVSTGSLTASIVHPREVFSAALLSAAAALIFVHQHPSGDPEPSREDLDISRRLQDGAKLLGIRVLDFVIIGEGRYVSFADRGLIGE